jgi:plasmid stabilization system protein ParE
MRQPDVAREVEYLEEALEEAEAAARWYAERSVTAAAAFSEDLDAAELAIAQLPEAWPQFDHGTHRHLLRRFPFSIVYRVEPRRILIVAASASRVLRATSSPHPQVPRLTSLAWASLTSSRRSGARTRTDKAWYGQ